MALANVLAKLPKPGTGSYALCFCVFSLESVFSLQSSPLAVLRRLVCAADNNAGVKRPGYEANNFRVPCTVVEAQ